MGALYLQTERMNLREFAPGDEDNLVALDNDPEVMRFISDGVPTPLNVIRNETLPMLLRYHANGNGLGAWAAMDRENGQFLGWFHLRPFEEDVRVLELGYRFVRHAWGRGLATEGSRALVAKAFAELGADRVVAKTMRSNRGSRRVMEKAGLALDSEFVEERFPGEDKAAVLYSLTRDEFEARSS